MILRRLNLDVLNMDILNELMRDLICWLMFVEFVEDMLMLSPLSFPAADDDVVVCLVLSVCILVDSCRVKPISLLVTMGLVHGDCSGVVWQLWWRGLFIVIDLSISYYYYYYVI